MEENKIIKFPGKLTEPVDNSGKSKPKGKKVKVTVEEPVKHNKSVKYYVKQGVPWSDSKGEVPFAPKPLPKEPEPSPEELEAIRKENEDFLQMLGDATKKEKAAGRSGYIKMDIFNHDVEPEGVNKFEIPNYVPDDEVDMEDSPVIKKRGKVEISDEEFPIVNIDKVKHISEWEGYDED